MLIAMEGLVDYAKRDPSYGSRQPIVACKSLVVLCCVHQVGLSAINDLIDRSEIALYRCLVQILSLMENWQMSFMLFISRYDYRN